MSRPKRRAAANIAPGTYKMHGTRRSIGSASDMSEMPPSSPTPLPARPQVDRQLPTPDTTHPPSVASPEKPRSRSSSLSADGAEDEPTPKRQRTGAPDVQQDDATPRPPPPSGKVPPSKKRKTKDTRTGPAASKNAAGLVPPSDEPPAGRAASKNAAGPTPVSDDPPAGRDASKNAADPPPVTDDPPAGPAASKNAAGPAPSSDDPPAGHDTPSVSKRPTAKQLRENAARVLGPPTAFPPLDGNTLHFVKEHGAVLPTPSGRRIKKKTKKAGDDSDRIGKHLLRALSPIGSNHSPGAMMASLPFNPLKDRDTAQEFCALQGIHIPLPTADELATALLALSVRIPYLEQDAAEHENIAHTITPPRASKKKSTSGHFVVGDPKRSPSTAVAKWSPRYFIYPFKKMPKDTFNKDKSLVSRLEFANDGKITALDDAHVASHRDSIPIDTPPLAGLPFCVVKLLDAKFKPLILALMKRLVECAVESQAWYPHYTYESRRASKDTVRSPNITDTQWKQVTDEAFGPDHVYNAQYPVPPILRTSPRGQDPKAVVPNYRQACQHFMMTARNLVAAKHKTRHRQVTLADDAYARWDSTIAGFAAHNGAASGDPAFQEQTLDSSLFQKMLGDYNLCRSTWTRHSCPTGEHFDLWSRLMLTTAYKRHRELSLHTTSRVGVNSKDREMLLEVIKLIQDQTEHEHDEETHAAIKDAADLAENPNIRDMVGRMDESAIAGFKYLPEKWDDWDIITFLGLLDCQDDSAIKLAKQFPTGAHEKGPDGEFLHPDAHIARSSCRFPLLSASRPGPDEKSPRKDHRPKYHQLHAVATFFTRAFGTMQGSPNPKSMILADAPGLGKTMTTMMTFALWRYYQIRLAEDPHWRAPVMSGLLDAQSPSADEPPVFLGERLGDHPVDNPVVYVTKLSVAPSHHNELELSLDQRYFSCMRGPSKFGTDSAERAKWFKDLAEINSDRGDQPTLTPVIVVSWGDLVGELAAREAKQPSLLLQNKRYSFVFHDEAHEGRAPWTRNFEAGRTLSRQSASSWAVTATPVFNSPLDLIHIARLAGLNEALPPAVTVDSTTPLGEPPAKTRKDLLSPGWYADCHPTYGKIVQTYIEQEKERLSIQRQLRASRTAATGLPGNAAADADPDYDFGDIANNPPGAIPGLGALALGDQLDRDLDSRWKRMQTAVYDNVMNPLLLAFSSSLIRRIHETTVPYTGEPLVPRVIEDRQVIRVDLTPRELEVYNALAPSSGARQLPAGFQSDMRMSLLSPYFAVHGEPNWRDKPATKVKKAAELATAVLEQDKDKPAAEQRKIIIYTKWTSLLPLLQYQLRILGVPVISVSGSTPSAKRQAIITDFQKDASQPSAAVAGWDPDSESSAWKCYAPVDCRVLLLTDAISAGVNLHRASVLINLDPPWSYSQYQQLVGRVARIGQKRPVVIYDIIANKTIDAWMAHVLNRKKGWSELVTTVAARIGAAAAAASNRAALAGNDDDDEDGDDDELDAEGELDEELARQGLGPHGPGAGRPTEESADEEPAGKAPPGHDSLLWTYPKMDRFWAKSKFLKLHVRDRWRAFTSDGIVHFPPEPRPVAQHVAETYPLYTFHTEWHQSPFADKYMKAFGVRDLATTDQDFAQANMSIEVRNRIKLFLHRLYSLQIAHPLEAWCLSFVARQLDPEGTDDKWRRRATDAMSFLLNFNGEFSFTAVSAWSRRNLDDNEIGRTDFGQALGKVCRMLEAQLALLNFAFFEPVSWRAHSLTYRRHSSFRTADKSPWPRPDKMTAIHQWAQTFDRPIDPAAPPRRQASDAKSSDGHESDDHESERNSSGESEKEDAEEDDESERNSSDESDSDDEEAKSAQRGDDDHEAPQSEYGDIDSELFKATEHLYPSSFQ